MNEMYFNSGLNKNKIFQDIDFDQIKRNLTLIKDMRSLKSINKKKSDQQVIDTHKSLVTLENEKKKLEMLIKKVTLKMNKDVRPVFKINKDKSRGRLTSQDNTSIPTSLKMSNDVDVTSPHSPIDNF